MDVSGDSVSYCTLNVLLYLPELGAFGLIFVFFYRRWLTKCFGKLAFLKHLKFPRPNFLIFSLNWKVGTTSFHVSSTLFFRTCLIVSTAFAFYCSPSFCRPKIRSKSWPSTCRITSTKPLSLPSPVERKAKESVRNNGGILRELNHCVGHVQNYFQMEGNLTENSSVLR